LTASAGSREAPWRFKLQASITLLVAIVGIATGAILVYFDYRNSGELRAYRSAAVCATASTALTADSCRYTGLATVTASSQQTTLSVSLSFPSLPGHSFVATFPSDREPDAASIGTGAPARAVLWNAKSQSSRALPRFRTLNTSLGTLREVDGSWSLSGWAWPRGQPRWCDKLGAIDRSVQNRCRLVA
jgi:hypothetical protein